MVEFLYRINELIIILCLFVTLLVITELGYRQGLAASEDYEDAGKTQLSTLQGAVLGLLALLLAFSFAMAEARFEERRALVVDESNAIGTVYLRSQMLAEPYRGDIARLLRDYVDARLNFFYAGVDPVKLKDAASRAEQLQKELWDEAVAATQKYPHPVPSGMFITSLGDAYDVYEKREAARENHVPEIVLWLLFVVTIGAMEFVGYVCGVEKCRSHSRTMVIAVLLSLVILVIVDLDRPRRGLIEVSQESMLELRATMKPSP